MGRIVGLSDCPINFDVLKTAPLDARLVVDAKADLTNPETWQNRNGTGTWVYQGMIVWCSAEQKAYAFIKNPDKDGNPVTLVSNEKNWVEVGSSLSREYTGAITATDDKTAFSVAGGKALYQEIKEDISLVEDKLTSVYTYKGSVDYEKDLPSNASNGDVYNVRYNGSSGTVPNGNNYAWVTTENVWDKLGGTTDLSSYYTKAEVDQSIQVVNTSISTLSDKVDKNTENITTNTNNITAINNLLTWQIIEEA